MPLDALLEAILFFKGEPIALSKLSRWAQKSEAEIKAALETLSGKLEGRGLQLVWTEEEVMLGTSAAAGETIEAITKEELNKDLGKAALETLAIIIYRGPVSRSDIDYIRGVNSNFIVRNLLVRGLIERVQNPNDARSFLYKPTMDLVSHLGLSKIEEIPEYDALRTQLAAVKPEETDGGAEA